MDGNGADTGHKSGRTTADGSHQHYEGSAVYNNLMAGMMFVQIIISTIVGIGLSNHLGMFWTILVCVLLGSIGMFFGMAMGVVKYRSDGDSFREALGYIQMASEMKWRKKLSEAVGDTKKECEGFVVESARAVANRVANRVLARHARNLLEAEYREATLQDTNEIVNEEMVAFQEAIRNG